MNALQAIEFIELRAYLQRKGMSIRQFGAHAGLDKMTAWRVVNGMTRVIKHSLIQKVAQATDGEVGLREFEALLLRAPAPKPRKSRRHRSLTKGR